MNFANIKTNDISNGPGVRTSLFVSGCRLNCKGCFNYPAWKFSFGQEFDQSTQDFILASLAPKYVAGLSVLGGEPMEPENQEGLLPFLKTVKKEFADKNIWLYSGYHFEDFMASRSQHTSTTSELLSLVDVLVDGPFELALKKPGLRFHGSSNQRILNMRESLKQGSPISLSGF